MKILNYKILIISLFIIAGMLSCKNESKNKNTEPVLDELETEEVLMEEHFFRFPSPEEIFSFLSESDVGFKEQIVNDAAKHKDYLESKSQALNLGVYIADLAYLTMFDENETFDYFEAIHSLSDKLQISAAFSDDLLDRVQNNLDNIDSLVIISSDAYKDIVDFLVENEKENTLSLISIGAYTESLYLAAQMVDNMEEDHIMVQKIADQKFALENLYNYVNQHLQSEAEKESINYLAGIKMIYDNMQAEEVGENKIEEKEDGKLVFSGGSKFKFSKEEYESFANAINQVRTEIIK